MQQKSQAPVVKPVVKEAKQPVQRPEVPRNVYHSPNNDHLAFKDVCNKENYFAQNYRMRDGPQNHQYFMQTPEQIKQKFNGGKQHIQTEAKKDNLQDQRDFESNIHIKQVAQASLEQDRLVEQQKRELLNQQQKQDLDINRQKKEHLNQQSKLATQVYNHNMQQYMEKQMENQRNMRSKMGYLSNQIDTRRQQYAQTVIPELSNKDIERQKLIDQRVQQKQRDDMIAAENERRSKQMMAQDCQGTIEKQMIMHQMDREAANQRRQQEIATMHMINQKMEDYDKARFLSQRAERQQYQQDLVRQMQDHKYSQQRASQLSHAGRASLNLLPPLTDKSAEVPQSQLNSYASTPSLGLNQIGSKQMASPNNHRFKKKGMDLILNDNCRPDGQFRQAMRQYGNEQQQIFPQLHANTPSNIRLQN